MLKDRHSLLQDNALNSFGIDPHNGFLPSQEPMSRLNGIYEATWEVMLDRAMKLPLIFAGGSAETSHHLKRNARLWRRDVRSMPVLTLTKEMLSDIRFIRRARVALSFLAHLYIHSQPNPSRPTSNLGTSHSPLCEECCCCCCCSSSSSWSHSDSILERQERRGMYKTKIPAPIAVPWLAVSELVNLPPILTYADTVLWNWHLTDPSFGIASSNLSITTTFSNTETEHHFFMTSLLIELQGAKTLESIRLALTAIDDPSELSEVLERLTKVIQDMVGIFINITSKCNPSIFYWDVRTWFNGSDTSPTTYNEDGTVSQEAGLGWTFQGMSKEDDEIIILSGPSAGQSSVIHALDVFLGIDHQIHNSPKAASVIEPTPSFMEKMQKYMPGPHRRYLNLLANHLSSHSLSPLMAMSTNASTESKKSPHLIQTVAATFGGPCLSWYNQSISALCSLRDQHMRIVALYILIPARNPPPSHHAPLSEDLRIKKDVAGRGERGTGGTELVSFLKVTRERTRQAYIACQEESL